MHQVGSRPGSATGSPDSMFDGMRRSGQGERSRCLESQRAGSWWRSDLTEVLRHRLLGFRETCLTVGVREREIGRIHAIGRSIRPWRDPTLTIKRRSDLVSNEFADTTDGEHFRCDERLSHQSGRRLTSCLSNQCFKRHTPPLSCCIYQPNKPSRGSSRYSWTTRASQRGRSSARLHRHWPRGL